VAEDASIICGWRQGGTVLPLTAILTLKMCREGLKWDRSAVDVPILIPVEKMEDPVVEAAQLAFSVRLKNSSDVSENTKNAQAIAKLDAPMARAYMQYLDDLGLDVSVKYIRHAS
jgi:hypothetical protein